MDSYTKLPKNLLERGTVLKSEESIFPFEKGKLILSKLILYPHSKIKYHNHFNDCEFYIPVNYDLKTSFCPKGSGHELENPFDRNVEVISMKITDD